MQDRKVMILNFQYIRPGVWDVDTESHCTPLHPVVSDNRIRFQALR